MAISIMQNDTAPIKFPLSYSDGSQPNLAGMNASNFSMHWYNSTLGTVVCAGTFYVLPGSPNTVVYVPLPSEVATATPSGNGYSVYLTVLFPGYQKTWAPDTINILATH